LSRIKFTQKIQTVGARVRVARERSGLTQEQVAEKTGLSDGYVSLLEADRRQPSAAAIKLLGAALGVSEDWIRAGHGEMRTSSTGFNAEQTTEDTEIASGRIGLPPDVRDLLRLFDPKVVSRRFADLPRHHRKRYKERALELIAWVKRELEEYQKVLEAEHRRKPIRRRTGAKGKEH
jgi:transcriptional regulator with XRE-family HTH domain